MLARNRVDAREEIGGGLKQDTISRPIERGSVDRTLNRVAAANGLRFIVIQGRRQWAWAPIATCAGRAQPIVIIGMFHRRERSALAAGDAQDGHAVRFERGVGRRSPMSLRIALQPPS